MSDPAAPWWAEVQHLRPREDRAPETPAPRNGTRRFAREAREPDAAAIATLEHEIPDPFVDASVWGPEQPDWAADASDPWAETLATTRDRDRDDHRDAHRPSGDTRAPADTAQVWDDGLEEAFARTPSWTDDEHDQWLMPKGADRIENGRRTIEIRGQVDRIHGFTAPAETHAATRTGRRPARRPSDRFERRPDRVAMWAFLLGLLLILVAAFSKPGDAGAAVLPSAAQAAPAAHVLVVDAPAARPLQP